MSASLDIVPLVLIVVASYGVKRAGLLTSDDGGTLLRVLFYLGVPPLIFLSVLHVDLDASFLRLCLVAPAVIGVSLLVVLALRRSVLSGLDAATFGPLLTGAVVMNTGFLLPFVERAAGAEGLARFAVIDTLCGILTFSVVYVAVVRVAHDTPDRRFVLTRLALSPPLWALIAAVVVKAVGVTPPDVVLDSFELSARMVGAMILVALGLRFELRLRRPRLLVLSVALRFGLGAAVGALVVWAAGLEGLDAGIAMFAAIAPIGFNAITFAELEKLDVEFAAAQVSTGLLLAIVASPLTIQLVQ